MAKPITAEQLKPDWTKKCVNCGATPIVPLTSMCGPCTFGEAATAGGNWEWENAKEIHPKRRK